MVRLRVLSPGQVTLRLDVEASESRTPGLQQLLNNRALSAELLLEVGVRLGATFHFACTVQSTYNDINKLETPVATTDYHDIWADFKESPKQC